MKHAGLRNLTLGCWLLCALVAASASTAHDDHKPSGKPKSGKVAETDVQRLVRRYDKAQVVVVQQQLCLRTTGCATDEGRLLDAMETVRVVLLTLAERAQAGDADAAYERGLLSLRVAESHSSRSWAESDAQFPGTTAILRRRWAQETALAQQYLSMAAAEGHAQACLALAEHLATRVPQPEPKVVSRLFRCAVAGFTAQGKRAAAVDAFVKMRDTVKPNDPLMIETHSLIYRHVPPDRPWRQVEPAEALAVRKQAAP